MAQVLRAVEVAGLNRWRWVLSAESGQVLADHQVDLDVNTTEYEAFCDLIGYLDRHRLPHDVVGSEAAAVDRVSTWINEHVFGRALLARLSGTVRVILPEGAEFLLSRPLELARINGVPLVRKQVSLVYEPAGLSTPGAKDDVAGSVRILALFSMPTRSSVLALRRERYELAKTVRTIAAKSRKAIELRVLQYGVTRERLAEAVEEYPGWDVLHVSGHGEVGVLLLEQADGEPDPVSTDELIELLAPGRDRLKLAVLSACQSGAAEAASTLHSLGFDELAEQVASAEGASGDQVGLARGLVEQLGVTALAMRYPVADGFAVALSEELYPRLFGAGQPVDRAVALALPKAVGERPTAAVPAASIGTPMLVGAGAVGLRVAPPPGRVVLDPYAERMAWFPPEPERFVGRTQVLVEASMALAPESGRSGVLFVGTVGVGKSACALELAYQHRGQFGAMAWWQAPEQPDEFGQALVGFAAALETQLEIPMLDAVGSEADLLRFLPRLAAVLREEAVLLVLDNVGTLLSDSGSWRDPMWALLIECLVGHGGLSRVVLTSRVMPAQLDPDLVVVLPTHSLSIAESALLARELPHLGALLDDQPTAERTSAPADTNLQLVRRVLNMAQGHPKLLELADYAAAEPDRLAAALAAAEAAGRDAPVTTFFATGASELDGGQFMRLLTAWTDTALSGLPTPARTLVELLAHIEEGERQFWIVSEMWRLVWQELYDEQAPPLERAFAPLVSAVLVEVVSTGVDGSVVARQAYRLNPGVGEAIRAEIDPAFGVLVDETMISCLEAVYEYAHIEESRGGPGSDIAWSGLASTPYLLRRGRWEEATGVLDAATNRIADPQTTNRALGYVRRMLERDETLLERPTMANLYAKLLSRSDPEAAVRIFNDVIDRNVKIQRFDLAAHAAAECVRIYRDDGNLRDALEMTEVLKELTELAGFGRWSRVADECLHLTVLIKMGDHHEAASRAFEMVELVDTLPDDTDERERVRPVRMREEVLATALEAASGAEDWSVALDVYERIERFQLRRGASYHERARLRLKTAEILLRLGQVYEAEDVLRECQAVFEDALDDADDIAPLGEVFRLRALVQYTLGRAEDAVAMAEAGLEYSYQGVEPGAMADGHDAVAAFMHAAGRPTKIFLPHRLAALMLRAAVEHGWSGKTVVGLSDSLDFGVDVFPGTLDELVESVGELPGVRLDLALRSLVPDDEELDELFDTVVGDPLEKMRISSAASANYREERAAMVAAMRRIHAAYEGEDIDEDEDDEEDLGPFGDLEDWSAQLVAAYYGLREREKNRERARRLPGEPRLFGAQIVPPMTGHVGPLHALAFARLGDQPVAITADDESVRLWDVRTHHQIGEPITGDRTKRVWAMAQAESAAGPIAVIAFGSSLSLWDLTTREQIGEITAPYRWRKQGAIRVVACTVWNGRPIAVTGGYDCMVRLWDLEAGEHMGAPFDCRKAMSWAVAFGMVNGHLVALSGDDDNTVRIWDVEEHRPAGKLHGHQDDVRALACGTVDGRPIALSGSRDNTMRVWDLRDHNEIGPPIIAHAAHVEAVAYGVLNGRPIAVSGGDDRTVRLWDLESFEQIGPPLIEGRVAMGLRSVALGQVDDRPILLAGHLDGTLRVWDLDAHREIGMNVPARFAAQLPTTWTDPDTDKTYVLTGPIVDDEGSPWVYVDFDGFEPILAEPGSLDVTLNIRDVDDEYGLSNIITPPHRSEDQQ